MKMLIFLTFLFQALSSYAADEYPKLEKAKNKVLLDTDRSCKFFIEQACGVTTIDGKEKINYEGGAVVLNEINSYLESMNFKNSQMVEYSTGNSNKCMDGKSIKSINTDYAKPQSIDSDFLISWSDSVEGGRCIELKVKYNDTSNFQLIDYISITGKTQYTAICGRSYGEAMRKIMSAVQLECNHVQQLDSADSKYEKPISNVNSSDEPQVESNKPGKAR